jgi:anti-sigma factor RsiW
MNCEQREKTGLYLDGELEPASQQAFAGHLQSCPECAAAVLEQQELKKAVRVAGKRFSAPPELYAATRKQTGSQAGTRRSWWKAALIAACLVIVAALGFAWYSGAHQANAMVAQLVDQHVTMLASTNPYDVISEDPHTVKPWFQGKLPFTFNPAVPADSPFKLLGGKLVYAQRSPGAELVYQVRQHKISVFIFQARDVHGPASAANLAFTVEGWQQGGLQYYVITDAAKEDAERLRSLLHDANRQ